MGDVKPQLYHTTLVGHTNGDKMWAVLVGIDAGALLQPLTEHNSRLEFQVKWKGWSSKAHPDGTTWVRQSNLQCDKLLACFVQDLRRRRIVPLPGPPPATFACCKVYTGTCGIMFSTFTIYDIKQFCFLK